MEKVLLDLALAEAYCSQLKDSLHREGTKNYDSLALYYRQILDHYKITEQQLAENLAWYKNNPTELDSVCTNAMPVMLRWQSLNTNR